jgi:hypothetical protein
MFVVMFMTRRMAIPIMVFRLERRLKTFLPTGYARIAALARANFRLSEKARRLSAGAGLFQEL